MKKFGIAVFIVAIAVGVLIANLFSFGRMAGNIFNFSFKSSVKGSGIGASEIRDVTGFRGVDVGGVFQVEITAGKDFEVEVSADDNLLPVIETRVSNGILHIEAKESIRSHGPVRVRISAPDIESIEASGASKVSLANVKNDGLTIDADGASRVSLSGETAKLIADVSGASHIDAENLKATNARVDASGASHVSVSVIERLAADASGASRVAYVGSPKSVERSSSGASKIHQK